MTNMHLRAKVEYFLSDRQMFEVNYGLSPSIIVMVMIENQYM